MAPNWDAFGTTAQQAAISERINTIIDGAQRAEDPIGWLISGVMALQDKIAIGHAKMEQMEHVLADYVDAIVSMHAADTPNLVPTIISDLGDMLVLFDTIRKDGEPGAKPPTPKEP